jgi:hypothetical protein
MDESAGGKKAVVHIGTDKTGTSAIQNALFSARTALLSEARILYPSIAANQSIPLWTMFHNGPHRALQRIEPEATDEKSISRVREKFKASLDEDFGSPHWETLVISAEDLSQLYPEEVNQFTKWLLEYVNDIRVVAYVRHPVDWTRSVVQEELKQGETLGEVFEDMPRPKWRRRFTPWLEALGSERFHLVSYEEARENGGLVASFCDVAGLPRETVLPLASSTSTNESMSHEATLLADSLNRQRPLYRDGKLSTERRWYGIDAIMTVPGNRFRLSPENRAKAGTDNRQDLQWLNDSFNTNLYPDVFEDGPLEEDARPATMPQETTDALAIRLSNLGNEIERRKLSNGAAGESEQLNSLAREWVLWHIPPGAVCAEIGVDRGAYSKQILDTAHPVKLHLVDPWEHHDDPVYEKAIYGGLGPKGQRIMDTNYEEVVEAFSREISEGRIHVYRDYSHVAAARFEPRCFDWVYIDANHQYDFVKHDLEAYYPLIKPGGFLCGDDYGQQGWWEVGVEEAVDEFVAEKGLELHTRRTQFVIPVR